MTYVLSDLKGVEIQLATMPQNKNNCQKQVKKSLALEK